MTQLESERFAGFAPESVAFLQALADSDNNNRGWFESHRPDYQRYILEPLRSLVQELGLFMLSLDSLLDVTPAPNHTISRIHRDTRFSRDKSPYRRCMWITFKRPSADWKERPCFFFEIGRESYRYGMGFYSASREAMERFRAAVDADPQRFRRAIGFCRGNQPFVVEGERYKRPLPGDRPAELREWCDRKSLYLVCNRTIDERLFSPDLSGDLMAGFELLAPLYHYLWKVCA